MPAVQNESVGKEAPTMRAVMGVIVGYAVMAIFVMVTFTSAYFILGADGVFKPGSYERSAVWLALSIVLALVAAVLGGLVCVRIARSPKPPKVLAILAVSLGLLLAIPMLTSEPRGPAVREGDVSSGEAMNNGRQPGWIIIVTPFLGAAGIMIGARFRGGGARPREPTLP